MSTPEVNQVKPEEEYIKDKPDYMASLTQRLSVLRTVVENMLVKKGKIYIDWLNDHTTFLKREDNFDSTRMRTYKRGEIIYVNFGFTVGSELGGVHYAVVTTESKASNPIVNVIPLGSLKSNKNEEDLHNKEVYLGVIPGMNGKRSYAIPNQLQPVSKMRIIKPTNKRDSAVKLESSLMDKLDQVVVSLYVKGYISVKEVEKRSAELVELQLKVIEQQIQEAAAAKE